MVIRGFAGSSKTSVVVRCYHLNDARWECGVVEAGGSGVKGGFRETGAIDRNTLVVGRGSLGGSSSGRASARSQERCRGRRRQGGREDLGGVGVCLRLIECEPETPTW